MADTCEVYLVDLELWQAYEHEVWKLANITPAQVADFNSPNRKADREQDKKIQAAIQARQMVFEFHNRHIGLSCRLAYHLALVLLTPTQKQYTAKPWKEALDRLGKALESSAPQSTEMVPGAGHGGIVLSEAIAYSLHRLVMPLVQAACQAIGKCFLAGEGVGPGSPFTVADLHEYDERLVEKIAEMANDIDDRALQLFWTDRAVTLAAYSRRPSPLQALPNPDTSAAALLYRLDDMPESLREYETLQRVPVRYRQQRARRLREEGLSGIVLSRSLEDVDRMLLSELMYPPLMRADRLLNTGYLVTERRPKQEKLRDALIVGFLPPNTGGLAERAFVKACWFNAMMVMAQILFRNQLWDSEFWWIEGDGLERYSSAVFPLSTLKTALKPGNLIGVLGNTRFRRLFLNVTRWQPAFLDPEKPWAGGPDPDMEDLCPARLAGTPACWILSTARTRRLASPGSAPGTLSAQPAMASSPRTLIEMIPGFAMAHFLTFLPVEMLKRDEKEEEEDPWGQKLEAPLKAGLRLASSPLHNLSINWVGAGGAGAGRPPPVQAYLARYFRQKFAWDAVLAEGDLRALAGKIEETWLDEMVRELQSDQ